MNLVFRSTFQFLMLILWYTGSFRKLQQALKMKRFPSINSLTTLIIWIIEIVFGELREIYVFIFDIWCGFRGLVQLSLISYYGFLKSWEGHRKLKKSRKLLFLYHQKSLFQFQDFNWENFMAIIRRKEDVKSRALLCLKSKNGLPTHQRELFIESFAESWKKTSWIFPFQKLL